MIAAGLVLAASSLAGCEGQSEADQVLRLGYIHQGAAGESGLRGAELAAEEAMHAARLVGGEVALLVDSAGTPEEVDDAAERLIESGVVALIGGYDEQSCRNLAEIAEQRGILFLNVGCRSDELRDDRRSRTLHIEATSAMYDAALARSGRGAVLWHGALNRFGAAQLNDRFEERFGTAADAPAWASWMAVKALWESASRSPSKDAASLLSTLVAQGTAFDGHKGEPLTFEPRTRQLIQPLFPLESGPSGDTQGAARLSAHAALPLASEIDLDPRRDYLFVTNEGSRDLTVIDVQAGTAIARIPLEERPRGIQVDPIADRVYVALSDDAPLLENDADAVVVIDLGAGATIARFPAGSDPEQFGVTPDGRLLYSSNEDAGTATAVDLRSGEVLSTVVVGIEPEGVAVSPDGRWVYVTAETSNTVSVIDIASGQVVASFLVDVRPRGVTFSASSRRAYVTNEITGTLSVIDVPTHRVVGRVELGTAAKPVGVVVSPDERRVYVATGHGNTVAVIDAESLHVVLQIPVGRRPWGITISPDGRHVFTANGVSNDVSVIDTGSMEVVRTIPVGDRPWGVALRRGS